MFSLLDSHFASPRMPIMEASVTMNGCIRKAATTAPFTAPTSAAAATAAEIASRIWAPFPVPPQ